MIALHGGLPEAIGDESLMFDNGIFGWKLSHREDHRALDAFMKLQRDSG